MTTVCLDLWVVATVLIVLVILILIQATWIIKRVIAKKCRLEVIYPKDISSLGANDNSSGIYDSQYTIYVTDSSSPRGGQEVMPIPTDSVVNPLYIPAASNVCDGYLVPVN